MTDSPKSTSTPKTETSTAASIFDQEFLERIVDWPVDGYCENEAAYSGPWRVEERDGEFAVVRDGDEHPRGIFKHHETACLVAAVLPAVGSDSLYAVRSCELLRVIGQAAPAVAGRFAFDDEKIAGALHVAAWFLRSPQSLALLLEAGSSDVLTTAGRLVAERRGSQPVRARHDRRSESPHHRTDIADSVSHHRRPPSRFAGSPASRESRKVPRDASDFIASIGQSIKADVERVDLGPISESNALTDFSFRGYPRSYP